MLGVAAQQVMQHLVLDRCLQLVRDDEVDEVDIVVGQPFAHHPRAERAVRRLMPLNAADLTAPATAGFDRGP